MTRDELGGGLEALPVEGAVWVGDARETGFKVTQACVEMMLIWTQTGRMGEFGKVLGGESQRTGLWIGHGE